MAGQERAAVCAWMDFDDGLFTIGETYSVLNELFDHMIEDEVML